MEVIIDDENIPGKYLIYLLSWKQTSFLIHLEKEQQKKSSEELLITKGRFQEYFFLHSLSSKET